MTRKYIGLMVINLIVCAAILTAFFGERGFLTNARMQREVDGQNKVVEGLAKGNLFLHETYLRASSEDAIRDALLSYGYGVSNELVYRFPNDQHTKLLDAYTLGNDKNVGTQNPRSGGTFSRRLVLAISGLFSIMSITAIVLCKRVKQKRSAKNPRTTDNAQGFWS